MSIFKKVKYCFVAFNLFETILEPEPMMTGCYQWIKVFKGDALNWRNLEDPQKYDVIQVNLDGMDQQMIGDLRERTKGSSTMLVGNQDYSPDIWKTAYGVPQDLTRMWNDLDCIFATSPEGKDLMELVGTKHKVPMIPHPCETDVIKKVDSTYKSDHIMVFYHRYNNETYTPYFVTKDLGHPVSLVGYMESKDPRARFTKSYYNNYVNWMNFPDWIKFLKEGLVGYEPEVNHSYGRNPCDAACVGLPMVGTDTQLSMRVLYPDTCFRPYDVKAIRNALKGLLTNEGWRNHVIAQAHYNVEYFNHKNSRERYMKMLEEAENT